MDDQREMLKQVADQLARTGMVFFGVAFLLRTQSERECSLCTNKFNTWAEHFQESAANYRSCGHTMHATAKAIEGVWTADALIKNLDKSAKDFDNVADAIREANTCATCETFVEAIEQEVRALGYGMRMLIERYECPSVGDTVH